MKKITERSVICISASLLLAIFLTAISLLLCMKIGFTSLNSIENIMDDVNYYEKSYEELRENCESLAIPYGLNVEVFDGVFTRETAMVDGHTYLRAGLKGSVFYIDAYAYRSKLKENIKNYVKENNLSVNGNENEIIDEFVNKSIKVYEDSIKIPYISTIGIIYRNVNKVVWIGLAIMSIFSIITIWTIVKKNPYKKNRIFRYMSYSTSSAFISTSAIPIYCIVTGIYKRIQIYPESIYRFVTAYLKNGLMVMLVMGIIWFVISIAFIITSSYIKHCYIKNAGK